MLKRATLFAALAALLTIAGLTLFACTPQTSDEKLVIDRQEIEMKFGETAMLTVKDKEPEELAWSSSNADIAEVDPQGKVTAVGTGEATITAQAGEKSVTCHVLVTLDILLTPDNIWLGPGETARIQISQIPEGLSADWSSAKTTVAVVDGSGNVSAEAPGKTEVTARVAGETAVCLVNVYSGLVAKEEVSGLIEARRPSEPQQNILGNESGLHEWLICLERWRTDLLCPGNPEELYENEAVAEIALASTLFFMEPVQPVVFRPDEVILDSSVFYEREYGYIENQAWLLLSYSKSIGIEVNDNTIIINAELEDCIGEADPGSYSITYDLYRREDGTFRLGQAVIDKNEAP